LSTRTFKATFQNIIEPLLSIKELTIQFKDGAAMHTAVQSISLDIQPGELMAIVGESGSGKSVTALSLLQLLPSDTKISGTAIFSSPLLPSTYCMQLRLTSKKSEEIRWQ
jgi:ABC-type glutathione transport system ATPase component